MTGFRLLLIALLAMVVIYTIPVIANHGMDLFSVFFGDMAKMGWPGQFNTDFMGFLVLSGTWMMWRNSFTPPSFLLGLLGFVGGIPVLTSYLLYLSFKHDGDMATIMLGPKRA